MLQTYRGTVVNQWFHKKRGKAVALIASSQQVLVNFGLCQICERRHHSLVGCDDGHDNVLSKHGQHERVAAHGPMLAVAVC